MFSRSSSAARNARKSCVPTSQRAAASIDARSSARPAISSARRSGAKERWPDVERAVSQERVARAAGLEQVSVELLFGASKRGSHPAGHGAAVAHDDVLGERAVQPAAPAVRRDARAGCRTPRPDRARARPSRCGPRREPAPAGPPSTRRPREHALHGALAVGSASPLSRCRRRRRRAGRRLHARVRR